MTATCVRRASVALGAVCFASIASAQVDPACVVGPPIWRGEPLSVWAQWAFETQPDNLQSITPNILQTVGGTGGETLFDGFATNAEVDSVGNWAWIPRFDNSDGALQAGQSGGQIFFKVQNWVDQEPVKWIRIQVEFEGSVPPFVSLVEGYKGDSTDPLPGVITQQPVFTGPTTYFMDWEIRPNPDWDLIVLDLAPGVILDRICIDTISLPTPGAGALLSLAGLVALRRRRVP